MLRFRGRNTNFGKINHSYSNYDRGQDSQLMRNLLFCLFTFLSFCLFIFSIFIFLSFHLFVFSCVKKKACSNVMFVNIDSQLWNYWKHSGKVPKRNSTFSQDTFPNERFLLGIL